MVKTEEEKTVIQKKRNESLDIIRIFSLFSVVSVHFMLNSGFYDIAVVGKRMAVMCIIRQFFMICVPMFLVLTGYLMNQKKLEKRFYKGIVKTLIVYLICSVIYTLFSNLYLHREINAKGFFVNTLAYRGTTYAWYIEMYIGLFLLIPFFNLIFNHLSDKKQCRYLLLTLFALVGLPAALNIFRFDSLNWWLNPSSNTEYIKIVPEFWNILYPIFYYFLGAYLSKYPPKLSAIQNILLLIAVSLADGFFNYYRSYQTTFLWAKWNDYSSGIIMLKTFLVFNLMLKIKPKKKCPKRTKLLAVLSDACLGAYLISCVFDQVFYGILNSRISTVTDRFIYAPVIVAASFLCSLAVSVVINVGYQLVQSAISKIISMTKRNNPTVLT